MIKILHTFLLLVFFIISSSGALAQVSRPGAVPVDPTNPIPPGTGATRPGAVPVDPTNPIPPGTGATRPGAPVCKCPNNYTFDTDKKKCIDPTGASAEVMCFKAACKPTDSNCTSSRGLQCNPSSLTQTIAGEGIMTAIGCIPTEPQKLVEGLVRYGTLAAGGIAFIIMLLAGLQMITAEGNPNTIKASQEKFYSAIIGLLLIIFSVLLMQVIGFDLLGLKGFGK